VGSQYGQPPYARSPYGQPPYGSAPYGQVPWDYLNQQGSGKRRSQWTVVVVSVVVALLLSIGAILIAIPVAARQSASGFVLPSIHAGALAPLPVGVPLVGTPLAPVPWIAGSTPGTNLTVVAGGVDYATTQVGDVFFAPIPVVSTYPHLRVDGDVRLVSGTGDDGVGLGCGAGSNPLYVFVLHEDQRWTFEGPSPSAGGKFGILADGTSSALRPVSSTNAVSVVCEELPSGLNSFMLAVNGATVANLSTAAQAGLGWDPVIAQCTCTDASRGQFSNVVVSSF
jgi:hypothetical protein